MKKSHIVQFLLNILLGPLGLFYSSTAAGIVFTVLGIALSFILVLIGWFVLYPFVIVTGFITVASHNRRVRMDEQRHRELVDAAREGHSIREAERA